MDDESQPSPPIFEDSSCGSAKAEFHDGLLHSSDKRDTGGRQRISMVPEISTPSNLIEKASMVLPETVLGKVMPGTEGIHVAGPYGLPRLLK